MSLIQVFMDFLLAAIFIDICPQNSLKPLEPETLIEWGFADYHSIKC